MDEPMLNKVWDVTNGLVRFYNPTNLGIEVANNMWSADGIGVLGSRSIGQPNITFDLETFGSNLKENYDLITEFVQDLLSVKYVTLEYQTESFQVFADIALSNVTKTEGYGQNGTFSETIEFEAVTKWYTFENLSFKTLANGEIISGVSKVYGGVAGTDGYTYIPNKAYTYYGETDIGRLSRWDIEKPFFSFIARLKPASDVAPNQQYGLEFLNNNGNNYSSILFTFDSPPDEIRVNTDVNDEYYQSVTDGTTINAFPTLDFQAYRTRIFQAGQMLMKNISEVEIKVKRKVDFI